MARGWESKSVEQQQAEMSHERAAKSRPLSASELRSRRQREGLLLSRTRFQQELQKTIHPVRRQMLLQALAEVERQLALIE